METQIIERDRGRGGASVGLFVRCGFSSLGSEKKEAFCLPFLLVADEPPALRDSACLSPVCWLAVYGSLVFLLLRDDARKKHF